MRRIDNISTFEGNRVVWINDDSQRTRYGILFEGEAWNHHRSGIVASIILALDCLERDLRIEERKDGDGS